jgi:Cu-Zn family superoxide dismutase
MGDLANIGIGADGSGHSVFSIGTARLTAGPNALLDTDGASLVIHAKPDDYKTDPSGNSGDRIACGVIGAAS